MCLYLAKISQSNVSVSGEIPVITASRPHLSLDGSWQFRTDSDGNLSPETISLWQTIDVPGPWQAQSDALRYYQGTAWYQRSIEIPSAWSQQRVFLKFGAVDYQAEVWVNGIPIGEHDGGYLPFEFDITEALVFGASNRVVVRVTDPDDDRAQWAVPFSEIPHGKQSWYGPLSGIWQSVTIEARPLLHITTLLASPNARTGSILVEATLSAEAPADTELALTLLDPDGMIASQGTMALDGTRASLTLSVDQVIRWDLDTPARYTLRAIVRTAETQDQVSTRIGFRTFEARDGCLWLNERPLMLRGALDQDYYPDGVCTPPSYEFLLHQAKLAKRMGLNCLRCHIKIADPRYLDAADEAGILVWAELPNWQHWTPEVGARGVATLHQAIMRDWNHPSVVIWSIINESWGIDQTNPEHRAWLRSAYEIIKPIAGDRLIVDNSACFNNSHLKSDLDDYHFYAAMPDERLRWREWVRQFAQRPKWSYAATLPELPPATERWTLGEAGYGDPLPEVERSGQEPLIVSEFGNWGLPSLAELRGPQQRDPWWFETGDDWGDGVVYPHGVEQRFTRLGLAHIFGDYEQFAAATRRAELDALRFEIEEMRRHPSIGGYVITEFSDVHWECNGLLDMRRNPKLPLDLLAALNADTVLILDREQGALWAGEQRTVPVHVSHWGATALDGAELRWQLAASDRPQTIISQQRSTSLPAITPRSTIALGTIQISAPQLAEAHRFRLIIELWAQGQRIAATEQALPVYPHPVGEGPLVYSAGSAAFQERLATLPYTLSKVPGHGVTVTDYFDHALRERVLQGEHVLLLAAYPDAIAAPIGPLHIRPRAGTAWQGSWASSFSWMAGEWPGDGILDETFMSIMPTHIIAGFAQRDFPTAVQAGLCVGWIQKPVALTGTWQLGRGSVTITTFRLSAALGSDPVATLVFDRLLGNS